MKWWAFIIYKTIISNGACSVSYSQLIKTQEYKQYGTLMSCEINHVKLSNQSFDSILLQALATKSLNWLINQLSKFQHITPTISLTEPANELQHNRCSSCCLCRDYRPQVLKTPARIDLMGVDESLFVNDIYFYSKLAVLNISIITCNMMQVNCKDQKICVECSHYSAA